MKLIKLFTSLLLITAIIRSSEVRYTGGRRYSHRALCANFDLIDDSGHVVKSSYQCGMDWDRIDYGIRRQIHDYETDQDNAHALENEERRLQHIKNDHVGYHIR